MFSIPVVAICSSKNFELVKNVGADWVFDYRDENLVEKVKANIPNISHVFDCIGEVSSSTQGSQIVQSTGGILCTVNPGKDNTENVESRVKVTDVLVFTAFWKDLQYLGLNFPVSDLLSYKDPYLLF